MEVIFVLIGIVAALAAIDVAALRWGVDSRASMRDQHLR
jgi:nitrogen fixation-related uncharacterized protein